jgi:hypothetical protein
VSRRGTATAPCSRSAHNKLLAERSIYGVEPRCPDRISCSKRDVQSRGPCPPSNSSPRRPWLGVVIGQGLYRAARGVRRNSVLRIFHNAGLVLVNESSLCPCRGVIAAEHGYRRAMEPVQRMTLQELRDELHRTDQAWETLDLDGVLADGELAVLSEDAHRHQMVGERVAAPTKREQTSTAPKPTILVVPPVTQGSVGRPRQISRIGSPGLRRRVRSRPGGAGAAAHEDPGQTSPGRPGRSLGDRMHPARIASRRLQDGWGTWAPAVF